MQEIEESFHFETENYHVLGRPKALSTNESVAFGIGHYRGFAARCAYCALLRSFLIKGNISHKISISLRRFSDLVAIIENFAYAFCLVLRSCMEKYPIANEPRFNTMRNEIVISLRRWKFLSSFEMSRISSKYLCFCCDSCAFSLSVSRF